MDTAHRTALCIRLQHLPRDGRKVALLVGTR
jgi:hypothetical protein